ncbi:MAG: energy-dependent translational throttle protein EttA [Acidobacteriota bacterium]
MANEKDICYSVVDLKKRHANRDVLEGITLGFYLGVKIGVIGANGSGKSTLLRLLAQVDEPTSGEVLPRQGLTIGYLPQEPTLDAGKTVKENVEVALSGIRALLDEHDALGAKLAEPMDDDEMQKALDRMATVGEEIERVGGWNLDSRLEQAMGALRCPPGDSEVDHLSGGERRRVALTRLLLEQPDFLLLDEPTNHLDADTTAWLQGHLAEYPGTVILVTHDRYFLDEVVGWMLELEGGKGIPYEGNYSLYLEQKAKRIEKEEKQAKARSKVLERELDWVRQGRKGRSQVSKARLSRFAELQAEEGKNRDGNVDLVIPTGERLGDKVLVTNDLEKSFGDRTLIDGLDLILPPGGILGVIGPNGAGKSTFLKMITGDEKPDSGTIELGDTVRLCHVDQGREGLDPNKTVFQEITDGLDEVQLGGVKMASRAYVGRFNFRGPDQEQKVGKLSGGQRNRVQLAKKIREGGNLMLLDEPTNDLDLMTLRVLEEAIQRFAGSAVVVSHDRFFLDRIATHVLADAGDGRWEFMEGNYADYEAWKESRGETATAAAAKGGARRKLSRD